jgi:hypothetical protein
MFNFEKFRRVKNFLAILLIFLLAFVWVFSGWPRIWQRPSVPPEIQKAEAATATYCFNSYSSETWDGTPTNIVDCSTSTGTTDNNNGQYVHMDTSEYTSGGTGTITKVETRVYYKNNWTSSLTTRNNVARLQPYFEGSNTGDTHNDAVGNHSTAGWSATFDITSDTNAPSTWTWADVAALDMRLIDYRPSSGQITVYRVEMIVTYNTSPTLTVSTPPVEGASATVGDTYNITYTLSDAEETVTAKFFYDLDGSGLDGTAISGCEAKGAGTGLTCSWNTTGVTPDTYYVYATTTDGINPEVNDYSPGELTIASAATVGCSTDPAQTGFETLTVDLIFTATSTATTTMSCTYGAGCALYIKDTGQSAGNPGLYSAGASDLINSSAATLSAGVEGYGIQAATTTAGTGVNLLIDAAYKKTGNDVGALATTNQTLTSAASTFDSKETVVTFKAAISGLNKPGNYVDTITFECLGN